VTVKTWSEPGQEGRPNEDWVHGEDDLLVVVDGATSRTETGCVHGVAWYAARLGEALVDQARNLDQPLRDGLAAAISTVAALHPDCELDHPGTPSAALGVVRASGDEYEILVLADVAVAIESTDGSIEVINDDRVATAAATERLAAMSLPIGDPQRPAALQRMKEALQRQQNRSDGFFVASSDPAVASEATVLQRPRSSVAAIAVLSDGAHRATELLELYSWLALMAKLRHTGPKAVVADVRTAEASDPMAQSWPRSKASDDASIAYLTA
jgi:hypothetical protein